LSDQPNLQDLTKLVLFSGRLSEVHIKNLKAFPFYFFNGVTFPVNLEHDISTVKEVPSLISYDLTLDQENDHMEKRYLALESAIRSLFWKEIKLKLSINGKEVYKSE
jgi:hypothetical protein